MADEVFHPPFWWLVICLAVGMPLASFLFARHAKSLYMAMDHYCDPEAMHRHPPSR